MVVIAKIDFSKSLEVVELFTWSSIKPQAHSLYFRYFFNSTIEWCTYKVTFLHSNKVVLFNELCDYYSYRDNMSVVDSKKALLSHLHTIFQMLYYYINGNNSEDIDELIINVWMCILRVLFLDIDYYSVLISDRAEYILLKLICDKSDI